jgi:hypothetical protein
MSTALGTKFQTIAAQFSSDAGLKFDGSDLDQMTVSFDDIAKEALMFGANAWPDVIEDDLLTDLLRCRKRPCAENSAPIIKTDLSTDALAALLLAD